MTRPAWVLLVDDSRDDTDFVRRALATGMPDVQFEAFRTGEAALTFIDSAVGLPDVVLLDLKMPGLRGHDVLKEIRRRHPVGRLPVVVFTSSREPSDIQRAYAAEANSYVVKPIVAERFSEVVVLVARYWIELNHRTREPGGPVA